MRLSRLWLFAVAATLIFLGIVWMIAAVFEPVRAVTGLTMIILGGAAAASALYVVKEPAPPEFYEARIIGLARAYEGKLTVNDVSSELGIPVSDAKRALSQLSRKGSCYIDFEETGEVGVEVYIFPIFIAKGK
ncbi:MAG: hypothetical protein QW057_04270 [Candidatus Bathyarchaeia archaeon]